MTRFPTAIAVSGLLTALALNPMPAAGNQCSAPLGLLDIQHEIQQNGNWCWVATVSEILNWLRLPGASQCELYDLWHRKTTTCKDMDDDPNWRIKVGNNFPGDPADAATAYGGLTVDVHGAPLTFDEIIKRICPEDGSPGKPFIWAYYTDDEKTVAHDVVVFGYFVTANGQRFLVAHNPNYPRGPELLSYEMYSSDYWVQDVMISR